MLFLIAIHTDFVASNDGLQTILLAEALRDIGTKLHANTTLAWATAGLGLRVCPQHFHHQTSLAWLALLVAVQFADIVQSDVVVGEQTSMQHEVLLANQSGQWQC